MIWATVSSQSCCCWLYRDSTSLAAKNIINLISVLMIWWCPCVVFSCVVGRWCLLWPVCSFGKTLISICPASFCIPRPNLPVTPDISLLPTLHSSPLQWQGHLFWVLVLEDLVCLHRTLQCQLLQHYWSRHRLGLLWYWMVCLGNEQRISVIFEIASKYCISDSFVDYDRYSISSREFLPTVVDIMVILAKFTHSSPF